MQQEHKKTVKQNHKHQLVNCVFNLEPRQDFHVFP